VVREGENPAFVSCSQRSPQRLACFIRSRHSRAGVTGAARMSQDAFPRRGWGERRTARCEATFALRRADERPRA